ncbi:hypothetical protein TraAM80_05551 [Trypanosoma rangeli]|uniref:Uncharacterized protein n=1 Tax=Trypanosoma rangeli TaxID=5698 RepID=A0A3R7KYE0_TRYRA|nr:uncharacterized protein TraAM80_05551 [Trypanosoma rangeli]RNF03807.1 hypothetical protein TraAM80_05551 [Trypanosoma rangeli]|eukprot:RNF03807.1 hypothetical protein TraAM80_05551 [Trypanosoma rangeli]
MCHVLSLENVSNEASSGVDERGRHQASLAEKDALDVMAPRERLPAACHKLAMQCLTYSRVGNAVVRSAWDSLPSPTNVGAALPSSALRIYAKTQPSLTRRLSWGKFTLQRSQHSPPIKPAACTATAAPDVTVKKSLAQLQRRNSPEQAVPPNKHALFDQAYRGLMRERMILEKLNEIVEEVRDAAYAADAEECDGLQVVHNPLADATLPLWAGEMRNAPAAAAAQTLPALPCICQRQTVCCNSNNPSGVGSSFAASPPSPRRGLTAMLQEQRESLGISVEPSLNAEERGTLLLSVTRPAQNLLAVKSLRGVDTLPDCSATPAENKELQPVVMEEAVGNPLGILPRAACTDMQEAGCGFHATNEGPTHDETQSPVPGADVTTADAVYVPPEEDPQRALEATLMEERACLEKLQDASKDVI